MPVYNFQRNWKYNVYFMIRIIEILVQYSIIVNPFKLFYKFTCNKNVLVVHYSSDFQTNGIIPMQFLSFQKFDISSDTIYIYIYIFIK